MTPQTITGQIKALEERLDGKLFKRRGRGLVPSELGQLVFRYADKMFMLSRKCWISSTTAKSQTCCSTLAWRTRCRSARSAVLETAVVVDNEQIHLRCFESTHEMLLSSSASTSWI